MSAAVALDITAPAFTSAHDCPSGGGAAGCTGCRDMCRNGYPGRFRPTEAEHAIEAGFASGMFAVKYGRVTVLRPAIIGWEGLSIHEREMGMGRCAFLGVTGACQLHDTGFKPIECRTAPCPQSMERMSFLRGRHGHANDVASAIEAEWKTPHGKAVMKLWRQRISKRPRPTLATSPSPS